MSRRTPTRVDVAPQEWTGPWRHYDIVKEGVIALVVVSLLTVGLAVLFGSPDEPSLTFKGWATTAPDNFYSTTVAELAGTSDSAGYGPPYNSAADGLAVGPLNPQQWFGVTHPVDPQNDFVITPLRTQQARPSVGAALKLWDAATPKQQTTWATNYDTAITAAGEDPMRVAAGDYGPVPALARALTDMASAGSLDAILTAQGNFYQTDYTKQILFMGDGSYLDDAATAANLQGNTWGMMNETGSYPGQAWLWMYSLWYQLPQTNSDGTWLTDHADPGIFYLVMILTLLLLLVPFIPGLRSIPKWIPIHRLIWRDYYRSQRTP
ncbi:MAG: hypothetical protein QOI06_2537 [Nocardioidaceae bacterium]|nr:hypothetical protein [Nocardioidaceae bacterium]